MVLKVKSAHHFTLTFSLFMLTWYASLAKRSNNVHAEEWHPAQKKNPHYNANSDGGFVIRHMVG